MLTKSAKAKGRLLQNWVREQLIFFLLFKEDEISTAVMGEKGADVKIVPDSQCWFPYLIECKSQKRGFSAVYDAYEQCENHKGRGEPLVFIKQNRKKPLAIVDAEYFIRRLHGR